jgi:hypothetical protein
MRHPGNLQLVDVLFVDLVQGGETVAVGGVTPVRPVFLLLRPARRVSPAPLRGADQRFGFKHPAKADRQRHGEHGGEAKRRAFFAGGLARKGQTRAARKASTPRANRREKSGQ